MTEKEKNIKDQEELNENDIDKISGARTNHDKTSTESNNPTWLDGKK